jgi:AcrR family transcriptional regulator
MPKRKRGGRPATSIRGDRPVSSRAIGVRRDAVANRQRVLDAAAAAFGELGVGVSLDEIARRAGVGPGTVHRHFSSKAALIDATIAARVDSLAERANALTRSLDPGTTLCEFIVTLTVEGAASHALAERLAAADGAVTAAVAEPLKRLRRATTKLLKRAQRAGQIDPRLTGRQLDAILAAAHALHVHPSGGVKLVAWLCSALRVDRSGGCPVPTAVSPAKRAR